MAGREEETFKRVFVLRLRAIILCSFWSHSKYLAVSWSDYNESSALMLPNYCLGCKCMWLCSKGFKD